MKLAIIVSHPIQYYVPVFQRMSKDISLKVFYTAKQGSNFDKGFKKTVVWDIPLLIGYEHEFVSYKNVIKSIANYSPTSLLVYGWAHAAHLIILYHFKGRVHLTFRGDSTLLNKRSGFKNFIKSLALKYIYSRVEIAFYVGSQNKLYYLKYGLKEHQLTFAPHSVDNELFEPENIFRGSAHQQYHKSASPNNATNENFVNSPVANNTTSFPNACETNPANNFRKGLGIPANDLVILYAGKLDKNKNPTLLLKAFIELELKNVHLVFAGSGILQGYFECSAQQHHHVHYLPFQNQSKMPALYHMCDLFCLPTQSDSWGLSINEAMAAGKAILISDKAGAAFDLVKSTNGKVFESNNLHDLKIKLKELLSNRRFLKEAGRCSKEIIKNWTIEIQVNNIIQCLDK
jgi:glycosyltransferase involved in cell wall biosynthesis